MTEACSTENSLYLGTAGWSYNDWNEAFYPEGTSQGDRLAYYATQFSTVEIDSTFYGTPAQSTVQKWFMQTPEHFRFAAKFPRQITHESRLVDCAEQSIGFVSRMAELGPKLGPLLIQLPPSLSIQSFHDLERFFEGLPDGFIYAVEVRHRSWLVDEFAQLLKKWNVALVLSCSGGFEKFWRVTSQVCYIRWQGQWNSVKEFSRVQIERQSDVEWWIPRMKHFLSRGGIIFGYVNNYYSGFAPQTAREIEHAMR